MGAQCSGAEFRPESTLIPKTAPQKHMLDGTRFLWIEAVRFLTVEQETKQCPLRIVISCDGRA